MKNERMLFIKVKDTIFESKSQRSSLDSVYHASCLSKSKIQFLKANHNYADQLEYEMKVVYQSQRYNF